MSTTLNGMFAKPKPHRIDFIKENKKKLKEISIMVNQNSSRSRFDLTKSKSSQTEVNRRMSRSSTAFKENKSTFGSRLSVKSSTTEKRDRESISSISLSLKQKSSQRVIAQKNQSCQTIDPRRCDQLYHEGVIKYPSNKVMQELAEIKKQKANRLDAHIKKEFFRRNKVKQKNPKMTFTKVKMKDSGKGDGEDTSEVVSEEEEKEKLEEKVEEKELEIKEVEEVKKEENPVVVVKSAKPPPPNLRAADIIKKTTQDLNPNRGQSFSEDSPTNKGDGKVTKKPLKKSSVDEEEVLKQVMDPRCPPGHVPLPDSERKKTLHMLRVSHAELVRELNLLPVRADTLRIRQKKIQLENQLNKIEEGIKVFNKSRVYVKLEE